MSARAEIRSGRLRRRTTLLILWTALALIGDGFLDARSAQAEDFDLTAVCRTSVAPLEDLILPSAAAGPVAAVLDPPGRPPWR